MCMCVCVSNISGHSEHCQPLALFGNNLRQHNYNKSYVYLVVFGSGWVVVCVYVSGEDMRVYD